MCVLRGFRRNWGRIMNRTTHLENNTEENVRSSEVIGRQGEPVSSKQEGASYEAKKKLSLRVRYVYGFIFFLTNLVAWFVRDYGHKILKDLPFFSDLGSCGSKEHDHFYAEGVLRVSLGCFSFFSITFVTTFGACKLQDARNSWHCKWWSLKLILWVTTMTFSFIIPVAFVKMYGEIARIGAG